MWAGGALAAAAIIKNEVRIELLRADADQRCKTLGDSVQINGRQRELRLPRPFGMMTTEGHISLVDASVETAKVLALAREGVDN